MDSFPLHIPLSVAPRCQGHRRPGHRRPGLGACSSGVFARRQCAMVSKGFLLTWSRAETLRTQSGIKVTLLRGSSQSCCASKCQQMLKISCRWTTWWCSMCLCLPACLPAHWLAAECGRKPKALREEPRSSSNYLQQQEADYRQYGKRKIEVSID